jgi:hypothetical protein
MEWLQFAIILVTFVGLFIWNRTESRADSRHMDAKLESNRNLSAEMHKENKELIHMIHAETQELIKDFHGRLCAIEERNRGK